MGEYYLSVSSNRIESIATAESIFCPIASMNLSVSSNRIESIATGDFRGRFE